MKLEIPYETGNGLALGVALANPSTTAKATVTEVVRDETGNQLSTRSLKLPAHNHTAFNPTALNTVSRKRRGGVRFQGEHLCAGHSRGGRGFHLARRGIAAGGVDEDDLAYRGWRRVAIHRLFW